MFPVKVFVLLGLLSTQGNALPCDFSPCLNSGICDNFNSTAFTCQCGPNYDGDTCQNALPCAANPCQNNATCSNAGFTYSCLCKIGFKGRNCDTAMPIGSVRSCTFENGATCFLTNSTSDNFDWSVRTGPTPSGGGGTVTGPASAYEGLKYAYTEMSYPRRTNDKAILATTQNFTATARCLSFAYHMFGSKIGSLTLRSSADVLWTRSGSIGPQWNTETVSIPSAQDLKLSFEAQRSNGWSGDIALDDIWLTEGECGCKSNPCQNGGSCISFDGQGSYLCACTQGLSGLVCEEVGPGTVSCSGEDGEGCFLQQAQQDDFDWSIGSGPTHSRGTGPSSASQGSKYYYIEASHPRKNKDVATLESVPSFTNFNRCLSFDYHMYGNGMGSLSVRVGNTTAWSVSGDQGNHWYSEKIDLPEHNDLKVYFDATRGVTYKSDIAIDNVILSPGTCDSQT